MDCFLHESFIMRYVYMAGSHPLSPPSLPVVARLRTCGSKLQCHGCRYNSSNSNNNVRCPPPLAQQGLRAALWLMMCLIGIIKQNKCQLLYQCAVSGHGTGHGSVQPMKFLGIMPELQSYWIARLSDQPIKAIFDQGIECLSEKSSCPIVYLCIC